MKKRFMALVLGTLMIFSMLSTTSFALEDENIFTGDYVVTENDEKVTFVAETESVQELSQNGIFESINLSSVLDGLEEVSLTVGADFNKTGIESTVSEQGISLTADNQQPVAELRAVILNPESVVDGSYTTETQIAWLWSYNGVDFTYDPDGDELIERTIGGIEQSDIIGTVGDIGFVTQFQTPAQYILYFQVKDSKGALSNLASYSFKIEPSDGNTRPVCRVGYSSDTVISKQLMLINWQLSTDNDSGDNVTDYDGMVFRDGAAAGNLKNYQLAGEPTIFSFSEPGDYTIWIRVKDTHGAYSDWVIFSIRVNGVTITNFEIKGISELESENRWWINDREARKCNVIPSKESADYLCETFGSTLFPWQLPNTFVMSGAFEVTGTLLTSDGEPLANTSVQISMPVTGSRALHKTILTDASGTFSYKPTLAEYWVDLGYYGNISHLNYAYLGDYWEKDTTYIRYSPSTGTNHIYATRVSVSVNGITYKQEEVTCEVGYTKVPTVGNLKYENGQWEERNF